MTAKTISDEELGARIAANTEARLERIAAAKESAPAGKEPLDVETIKRTSPTNALGKMTDEELRIRLEVIYYIDSPKLMTNAQLAAYVEELSRWS